MNKEIIYYPSTSDKPVGNIRGKYDSNIKLYRNYGINVYTYPTYVKLTSTDPIKLQHAKKKLIRLISNTISVYAHPQRIDNLYMFKVEDTFKLTLYREDIQNLYSMKRYIGPYKHVVTTKLGNPNFQIYTEQNLLPLLEPAYKAKITIGRVCYYDAHRNKEISNLDKAYNFVSFKSTEIGYGKDLKSTWTPELSSKQIEYLLNKIEDLGFELIKVKHVEGTEYIDVLNKKRVYVKIQDGITSLSHEREIIHTINIIRIDGKPDIRVRYIKPSTEDTSNIPWDSTTRSFTQGEYFLDHHVNMVKEIYCNKDGLKFTIQMEQDENYYTARISGSDPITLIRFIQGLI
jgi:hypothetical protein